MAISRVVSEMFNVEKYRGQGSIKVIESGVVPIERLGMVSY